MNGFSHCFINTSHALNLSVLKLMKKVPLMMKSVMYMLRLGSVFSDCSMTLLLLAQTSALSADRIDSSE